MHTSKMKVYFAHAKPDYGSQLEASIIRQLEELGMEVVNPSDPKYQNTCVSNQMDYWFGIVEQCDSLAFISYHKLITAGVGQEVNTMLSKGGKVWHIRFYEDDLEIYCLYRVSRPIHYSDVEETRACFKQYDRKPQIR